MSLLDGMKAIYFRMTHGSGKYYAHSPQEDQAFLDRFPEPATDLERSLDQYLCQKWSDAAPLKYFLSNCFAALLLIPYKLRFIIQGRKCCFLEKKKAAAAMDFAAKGVLPVELSLEREEWVLIDVNAGILTKDDLRFLKQIRPLQCGFFFSFKCLCRVAAYSQTIRQYHPEKILSSAEYSFTSSLLTAYCEENGIEHINIMHGEKLFELTNAFCRFSRFYVWDTFYIRLFNRLRCCNTEYAICPLKVEKAEEVEEECCTYYLQSENHKQLESIRECLMELRMPFKVRTHPVYDTQSVHEVFSPEEIEDPSSVTLQQSFSHTKYAISLYSTVLYQAYLAGKTIIMDDVTNPAVWDQLSGRDYIMLDKPSISLKSMLDERAF